MATKYCMVKILKENIPLTFLRIDLGTKWNVLLDSTQKIDRRCF